MLVGDVSMARATFERFYSVWRRFGLLPERYEPSCHLGWSREVANEDDALHYASFAASGRRRISDFVHRLGRTGPIPQDKPAQIPSSRVVHSTEIPKWHRFLWDRMSIHPSEQYYPLRPELVESAYHLFSSTRDPAYRSVGKQIYSSLINYTKVVALPGPDFLQRVSERMDPLRRWTAVMPASEA